MKNQLEILPVKWIDIVLEVALEAAPQPLPEDEPVKVDPKPECAPAQPGAGADLKH